jgi:hypothetical protein
MRDWGFTFWLSLYALQDETQKEFQKNEVTSKGCVHNVIRTITGKDTIAHNMGRIDKHCIKKCRSRERISELSQVNDDDSDRHLLLAQYRNSPHHFFTLGA